MIAAEVTDLYTEAYAMKRGGGLVLVLEPGVGALVHMCFLFVVAVVVVVVFIPIFSFLFFVLMQFF